jgi:SAM-dependent methyltransferase
MNHIYTPGYSQEAVSFMQRRSAETHAAFVLPLLQPDFRILDVGCGPGSISIDLATRVPQGGVVAVDSEPSQVLLAKERAKERDISNIRFIVGNAAGFHCETNSFDLVFSHALFEHLSDPEKTLQHLSGYLRPGGLIALRSPDWGGFVLHPETSAVCDALRTYQSIQTDLGGDVHCGRKLGMYLRGVGLKSVKLSASYEIYPDPRWIANYLAERLKTAGKSSEAATLRSWADQPNAMFAQAWFEAVGVKPDDAS